MGGQPALLAPVLALTDRIRTSTRLAVVTVVLLVPGLVSEFSGSLSLRLAITAVGFVVGVWVAAAVWWRTRHDVNLAVVGVCAIAEGDLGSRPLPDGGDELGDIGRAIGTARVRLAEADVALKDAQQVR